MPGAGIVYENVQNPDGDIKKGERTPVWKSDEQSHVTYR